MTPQTLVGILIFAIWFYNSVKILREYERGVIFRLGKVLPKPKGPGLILVLWPIDKMVKVDLRIINPGCPAAGHHHPRQRHGEGQRRGVLPRDGRPERDHPGGALHLCHIPGRPDHAAFPFWASRNWTSCSRNEKKLNARLQSILDQRTDAWGIKVTSVEVKTVDLPQEMVRAISKQAEAERERRAKVIHAEGEFQAAGTAGPGR